MTALPILVDLTLPLDTRKLILLSSSLDDKLGAFLIDSIEYNFMEAANFHNEKRITCQQVQLSDC